MIESLPFSKLQTQKGIKRLLFVLLYLVARLKITVYESGPPEKKS